MTAIIVAAVGQVEVTFEREPDVVEYFYRQGIKRLTG